MKILRSGVTRATPEEPEKPVSQKMFGREVIKNPSTSLRESSNFFNLLVLILTIFYLPFNLLDFGLILLVLRIPLQKPLIDLQRLL